MRSTRLHPLLRRLAVCAAATLAVALAAAPGASASFTTASCASTEGIFGRGASFQNNAVAGFNTVFHTAEGCGPGAPNIIYDPAGSGAGRSALGRKSSINPNQDRDITVRFAGTDEGPTPLERQQIEKGPIDANGADVTAADDGKLHVIPVAIGANTVAVNLPDSCTTYPQDFRERPTISNVTMEKIWAAEITRWGDAIPGLAAGACADAPIKRVVRKDDSGTTFSFKQYLAQVNSGRGWAALANQAWPNDSGASAVLRAADNGNGPLRDLLAGTDGGIGYGDLGTVRGGSGNPFLYTTVGSGPLDDKFYLPLQVQNTATYRDPSTAADGYKTSRPSGGANCNNAVTRNGGTSTFDNWHQTDSTYTPLNPAEGDYNACALTYDLAFDDNSPVYCNSATEERKARTLKDFLERAVVSEAGQSRLLSVDYGRVPADLLVIARQGVGSIDWKKGTDGRPCSAPPVTTTASTSTSTSSGGSTTPSPAAPSNAFTISSVRFSRNRVRVTLQLPGAGTFTVSPTVTPRKGRTIRLSRSTTTVSGAGTQKVSFSLSKKAQSALKRFKTLKLRVAVAYTPKGGVAARKIRTITIKRAKR